MSEHLPQGDGKPKVEIGLDGKPFEGSDRAPQLRPVAPETPQLRPFAPETATTEWVGDSHYLRGPAETAMLEAPRRSMELNHFAWYSLGLGVFALVPAMIFWKFAFYGGRGYFAPIFAAAAGTYYGVRSHNAGLRGFCTNGRLGTAGLVISIVAGLVFAGLIIGQIAEMSGA